MSKRKTTSTNSAKAASTAKYAHLDLEDRFFIEACLDQGWSKTRIAKELHKDPSTICKEVQKHRHKAEKKDGISLAVDCADYAECKMNSPKCENRPCLNPSYCKRRDRTPGVCNGCKKRAYCKFTRYFYDAKVAQKEYEATLVGQREGVNLSPEEAKTIGNIIAPLLKKGQSVYQILQNHPEIGLCQSTLYHYIEWGVFKSSDVSAFDLRVQLKRKLSKKTSVKYKKRRDSSYLIGRDYKAYNTFVELNPDICTMEMDTVYNSDNGPYIQTFLLFPSNIFLAVLRTGRKAEDMVEGIDLLESMLGRELFEKYCGVILTDRGPEFSAATCIEFRRQDGSRRAHVFYCDPMASGQKGSLEHRHIALRYILPKKKDLFALGLDSQEDLNLVVRHINSSPLKGMGGKTPFQTAQLLCPDLYEKLISLGFHPIDPDDVTLDPSLLK